MSNALITDFSKEEVKMILGYFSDGHWVKFIAISLSMKGDSCTENEVQDVIRHEMNRMKEDLGE